MAQFTVRVELHDALWADYDTLHAAMAQRGFSRRITSDQGCAYELPWAEYAACRDLTSMQILDIACQAAAATGRRNSVLVTEAMSCVWAGLAIARG